MHAFLFPCICAFVCVCVCARARVRAYACVLKLRNTESGRYASRDLAHVFALAIINAISARSLMN
jgi:hypothetical protein